MGLALEVITAEATLAAGGSFETLTVVGGNTATVRNAAEGSLIHLEELWAVDDAHKALFSVKSPNLHDQTHGLLLAVPSGAETGRNAAEPEVLFPGPETLPLEPSDTLTLSANGTTGDHAVLSMLARYDNLRGADADYLDWPTVQSRLKTVVGVEVDLTSGSRAYGAQVALDATDDRLKAGRDYAILGILTDTPVCTIGITGPATSNYRLGMPGKTDPASGGDYFVRLSQKYGTPHIPRISGSDKGTYLLDALDVGAGGALKLTVVLAQLS